MYTFSFGVGSPGLFLHLSLSHSDTVRRAEFGLTSSLGVLFQLSNE